MNMQDIILTTILGSIAFAIVAPILGCLLDGIDRKITARMQGRVGPKILQPYWDVRKLLEKEDVSVNGADANYVACALLFAILAGGIFFSGGNFLMCIFVITLSSLFFIVAAYSTRSPYAEIALRVKRCRCSATSLWCCSRLWDSIWPQARSTFRA